jgi:hypothetical protein
MKIKLLNKMTLKNAMMFFISVGFAFTANTISAQSKTNVVEVGGIADLPPASSTGEIKLNPFSVYVIHGMVDLGVNYININGAGIRGVDPGKDGFVSKVEGAVLRSKKNLVFIENLSVLNASRGTSAYDFEDTTGNYYCNIFSGSSVIDAPGVTSKGVGTVRGFNTTCIDLNYWDTADGIKIGGKMLKFTSALNYITGIKQGAAFEIMGDAIIEDIVATGNYFVYKGGVGVKVNPTAQVKLARFSLNLFKGQDKFLEGIDSYTPGWQMFGNGVGVPDTQAKAYFYMTGNSLSTNFQAQNAFEKIQGNTVPKVQQLFQAVGNNKFKYTGTQVINVDLYATVNGISSTFDGSYTLAIMKNGVEVILPNSTVSNIPEGQGFSISLTTDASLVNGDELEVFIKSNNNPKIKPVIVSEMVFKIEE